MKIGVYLEIKSMNWRSKDALVLKFKILGYKNEGRVGVVPIGLLESKLSFSILSKRHMVK